MKKYVKDINVSILLINGLLSEFLMDDDDDGNKSIKTNNDDITYIIHKQYQTAEISEYESKTPKGEILIPKFIKYHFKKYEVTNISDESFEDSQIDSVRFDPDSKITTIQARTFDFSEIKKITLSPQISIIKESAFSFCTQLKEIEIPPDSNLRQIEGNAFFDTKIKSLLIPSKLTMLCKGWNEQIPKLSKITVMPGNLSYADIDHHQLLLGKSYPEKKNFDTLIFASRLIRSANIPDTIEIIDRNAFQFCRKMKSFILPPNVKRINKAAFAFCSSLQKFIIPSNSKLQYFEDEIWDSCPITSLFIPQHVLFLGDKALKNNDKLLIICIDDESELYHIDTMLFSKLNNTILMVPPNKAECII